MPAHLEHVLVAHGDAPPANTMLMTHGIYGSGANWRGIARKLVERRSDWGVVLVDLRHHGGSVAGEPPHTIAACADDLRALIDELGNVTALAGHSFGGKVMLATRSLVHVEQTWIFDANPSARPGAIADPANSVVRVLQLLERLPATWASRDEFIATVVADGHNLGLAQWLAMNVAPDGTSFRLRLDPEPLRELLTSYYATDLWSALRDPSRGAVELVIADRSDVFAPGEAAQVGTAGHVHVHHIDAGHWLHIDAPGPAVDLLATRLPR